MCGTYCIECQEYYHLLLLSLKLRLLLFLAMGRQVGTGEMFCCEYVYCNDYTVLAFITFIVSQVLVKPAWATFYEDQLIKSPD